jgi:hypothetical protein
MTHLDFPPIQAYASIVPDSSIAMISKATIRFLQIIYSIPSSTSYVSSAPILLNINRVSGKIPGVYTETGVKM